jgi:NAD+ kinase
MKSEPIEVPSSSRINLLVSMNPSFISSDGAEVLGRIIPSFAALGITSIQLYFMEALKTDQKLVSYFPPADFLGLRFQDDYAKTRIDWALVFGGDGALLWAHKSLMSQPQVVYFSVKTGNLGVLTSFMLDDMPRLFEAMAASIRGAVDKSRLCVKRYHRIRAVILDSQRQVVRQFIAINEIVLFRTTNYCPKFSLTCNGTGLLKIGADGLIICTPVGSTAYNSSVGGPTLMPYLPNYVLSAIAPFGINFRPFVFGPSDVLTIALDHTSVSKEFKTVQDSNNETVVREGEVLEIRMEETPELRLAGFFRNFQEEWGEKIKPIFKWDT